MKISIKVGSSSLHDGVKPRLEVFDHVASQISGLRQDGHDVVLTTSGAIAFGAANLPGYVRPKNETVPMKQALAALGQPLLQATWGNAFAEYGIQTGQVLVTNQEIFGIAGSKSHLIDTFGQMLGLGILPIVNENDSVAVKEIVQGDNDKLSAYIANLVGAEMLFILGTADALYRDYPTNKDRISVVDRLYLPQIAQYCVDTADLQGTGGMLTKKDAVHIVFDEGNTVNRTFVASAFNPDAINLSMLGQIGTMFTR